MSTHTWHTDDELLAAYVAGRLDAVTGASVEQHLARCADCRTAIRSHVDLPALDRAWQEVRTAAERPAIPAPIRAAQRLGLPEPYAVLLAATVSLRTPWLASALVALTFAVAAALFSGGTTLWPFLLLAPLIPVLGVAACYGPANDPLESLIVTAPFGRARLILLRTGAVLVACLPVSFLLGLMLPGPLWVSAAWLGPALALVPVLLAVASFVGPRVAAGLVAIAWSGVVLGTLRPLGPTWPVEPTQQLLLFVLALAAVAVLVARSPRPHQIGAVL